MTALLATAESNCMTEQRHRRELLLNAAALLSVPLALRSSALLAKLNPSRVAATQKPLAPAPANASPRIMNPTGSVKRRA